MRCIILLGIALVSIAISIMFFLIRRYVPRAIRDNESFFTTVLGVTSAIYGFFLGFVVVVLWPAFDNATLIVTEEANQLALIVWDSEILPEPTRSEIREGVGKYITAVTEKDFPEMREGRDSPEAFLALQNLFFRLQQYSPETEAQKTFYGEIVKNINVTIEKRRERLRTMGTLLIDPLRFILVFGVLLIGLLLSLIETKTPRLQLLAMLIVCGMI